MMNEEFIKMITETVGNGVIFVDPKAVEFKRSHESSVRKSKWD